MFSFFLIGYGLLCLAFLGYELFRKQRGLLSSASRFLIIVFFPVLGLVYLFVSDRMEREGKQDMASELENIFTIEKQELNIYRKINSQKEMNIVPLEESLLINDAKTKRRLLLDALKEESLQRISLLEMAIKDDDTETSHYAASALVEVKRNLMLDLQQLEIRYESAPFDRSILVAYTEVLKKFLSIRLMDQRTYRKYFHLYSTLLSRLLELDPKEEQYFVDKINCDLQDQDYEQAERYCQLFLQAFSHSETPYLMKLKYYYEMKNAQGLNRTLQELKSSSVKLSNHGLKMVRFWGNGAG